MSTDRFKHESLQDAESIIKYLEALILGFSNGAIRFSYDDNEFLINPQGLVNLEVEAKRKSEDVKLSLKFKWSERKKPEDGKNEPLSIEPVQA